MSDSKKQTIGYKILWGMHAVLSCGPIDKIVRIMFDGKTGWSGSSEGGRIDVDADGLFGGEKREGGVSGAIDFENGEPTQDQNDYLLARLGSMISGFRGVAALVFRQTYWGLNPYMKPVMVRAQRIHKRHREGIAQWYDDVAQIGGTLFNSTGWTRVYVEADIYQVMRPCVIGLEDGVFRVQERTQPGSGNMNLDGTFVNPADQAAHPLTTTHQFFNEATGAYIGSEVGQIRYYLPKTGYVGLGGSPVCIGYTPQTGCLWARTSGSFLADPPEPFGIFHSNNETQLANLSSPFTAALPTITNQRNIYLIAIDQHMSRVFVIWNSTSDTAYFADAWYELDLNGGLVASGSCDLPTLPPGNIIGNAPNNTVTNAHFDANTRTIFVANTGSNPAQKKVLFWQIYPDGVLRQDAILDHTSPVAGTRSSSFIRDGKAYLFTGESSFTPDIRQDYNVFSTLYQDGGCPAMNPAHMIREINTDPDNGLGYPEDDIDAASFTAAADTLYSEGFGLSAFWEDSKRLHEFRSEVLRHIDAAHYIDRRTGKFVLKLIRPDYDPVTLPVLDESVVERVENFSRPKPDEAVNTVHVRFWDCATGNGNAMASADDPALMQMQGGVIAQTIDYPWITNYPLAGRVAERDLRGLSLPLATCTIYATSAASDLHEGAAFKLQWPEIGVASIIMRVTHIAFGNGRSSRVRIQAVEDRFSMPATPIQVAPPPLWENPSQPPTPVEHQITVEAPYYELVQQLGQANADNQLALNEFAGFLVTTGAQPGNAINASIAVNAGAGYETTGAIDFCPFAVLDEDIGPTATVIAIRDGVDLDNVTIGTHAQIGEELVRIDAVSDTELTIGRGVLDTVPATIHADGTKIFFWDEYGAGGDQTEYAASAELDVKLLAINGSGSVPLSQAPARQITFDQRAVRPYAPGNFQIDAAAYPDILTKSAATTVSWSHRDRLQQTAGTIEDTTAGNIGPEPGTTYTVQILDPSDDSLISAQTGITGTSAIFDTSALSQTFLTFAVWSVRDGLTSWQRHEWTVFAGEIRATEAGDARITENGNLRILE